MKVSKTGYKKNSKDKNEPALVIPSNKITMKGVEFPVFGMDDTGYSQMMYPGLDYSFPGNYVYETPAPRYIDTGWHYPTRPSTGVKWPTTSSKSTARRYPNANYFADGGYILPGRFRNPEGNWLSKYQYGKQVKKSIVSAEELPEDAFPYEGTSAMFRDERYNIDRAKKLYTEDEFGHLPSIDYETGEWLKAKRYPTSWKEFLQYALNSEVNKLGFPTENKEGFLKYPNYANGGDISIPDLSRPNWLDKYQDGSEVAANLPWINSQGQYQEPVKTSKALSDDDLHRIDISETSETTDTPAVRLAQQVALQQHEDWQNRKPIAKKPVSKKENYASKIATYAKGEDKKVIDAYYKKYDPANEDQVKTIQAELVAKNFLPGPAAIDGKFGDKTKQAYLKYKTAERVGDLSGETEKSTCSYDGCAEYVSSVTRPYGWVLGDAWTMKNNIETNGGTVKYNIYTDPRFSKVKSKDQLKNVTETVKRNNKATAEMFDVGDVVGLYYKGSGMHQTALKDGRGTYNTHVGVVTEIKDGKPVISHNIHGKLHHDAYDNLTIGWIGTPAPRMAEYKPSKQPETLKDKINIYSKELTEILAPGVDSEKIANNIKGILRKETGLGRLTPTEADIKEIQAKRFLLGESTDPEDISRGIGKLKTATIPDDMKYFLGINDENIDDDAGVKAAVYKYVDAYNQLKKYSQNNPQLNLTDEDLHQMSILAYNQGTDKLLNLGYNNPSMPISSEVDALRDLYSGNVKDISSTNFKYLPSIKTNIADIPIDIDPGQALYDYRYPEGHESYISRVNKYANTPIEELEASMPSKKLGGWLERYQDGAQVAANLPWINQSGQYKDPTGVGPTVAKAEELKQKKLIEAARNSPSGKLPSGAITPVMGPVEYALMAPVAASSIMKAAPLVGSAMNAPIAGLPGVTAGNALGAGFAADAAINRLPQIPGQLRRGEYADAAVNAVTGLLDVGTAGMLSPLYKGAKTAAQETNKYLQNKYLDVAEGSNPFNYAWKSPAERFDPDAVPMLDEAGYIVNSMPTSEEHFRKIKNLSNLTDDEKYLIKQYEKDSRPFTGRNDKIDLAKRNQLDDLLRRTEVITDEPLVMSRRIKSGNPELFNLKNGVYTPGRPTSWSAGRDAVGNESYSGGVDRMVMKLPKGKNRVLKNPYESLNADQLARYKEELRQKGITDPESIEYHLSMFNENRPQERELLLDPYVDLKKMGKVKNSFGGYDYVMKPKFYKNGGLMSSGEGYYDYINGYSGIFAKGGSKGWLDNYK